MRRRDLVILLAASSLRVSIGRADDKAPIVGLLMPDNAIETENLEAALRRAGIDPGTGVQIKTLAAAGDYERLPQLATEFVNRRVTVIRATGEAAALAAKAATTEIPIVFGVGLDPVELGLVKSYNRPGGNLTGVYLPFAAADAKRLQLLHELVPQARVVGVLVNPKNRDAEGVERLRAAAPTLGIDLRVAEIRGPDDLAPAFADFAQHRAAAVFEATDRLLNHTWTGRIVALANAHRLPIMGVEAGQTAAGLLACYGADLDEARRIEDTYVVRVLKGAKPADLPVQVPTKFKLVINLKTAKALGLSVPQLVLALADEVIE